MEDTGTQKTPAAELPPLPVPPQGVPPQGDPYPPALVPTPEPSQASNPENSPGTIILQWLTYAFWGWTTLSLGVLLVTVLAYMLNRIQTGEFTPYGIAAVLVLLPISVVCDLFYSKNEPEKKTGAAAIVMVIHAVIFALFAIGSLIWFVFALVSLTTSRTDTAPTMVQLVSTIIIAILYAATLLRTIKPTRLQWIPKAYTLFMLLVSAIVIILALVGPVAGAQLTKNDRLISENIGTITTSIREYAKTNNKLPEELSQLTVNNANAKKLISDNLIAYTPNTKAPTVPAGSSKLNKYTVTRFYYTMCVDYKKSAAERTGSDRVYGTDLQEEYDTSPNVYNYPAGKVCYKIVTS